MTDKEKAVFDKILKMFPKMPDWVKVMLTRKVIKSKTVDLGSGCYYTTDPVKLLGCGATVYSSYSPDAPFYDFLPSFIFQDYVGMLYRTTGDNVKFDYNGVEFECPAYATRRFVLTGEDGGKICMPSYGFASPVGIKDESASVIIKSDDKAPEIHLDGVLLLERDNGGHYAVYGNRIFPKDSHLFKDFLK